LQTNQSVDRPDEPQGQNLERKNSPTLQNDTGSDQSPSRELGNEKHTVSNSFFKQPKSFSVIC